jgi:hypothetical protein
LPEYGETHFGQFIQDFYLSIKVLLLRTLDSKVKKLTFKEIFNEATTDLDGDCYFDSPHKIIKKDYI